MLIPLNGSDWSFKGFTGADWVWRHSVQPGTPDRRGWFPAAVPGSVGHDLLQAGEIPDPYFERNSLLLEWIPERTWVYKKTFTIERELAWRRLFLHFEGVDYEAEFYLNGAKLGEHRGMFTPVRFEVSDRLQLGAENLLAVVIHPAPHEQPQVGYTNRVRTHKSRMTYWWDFCPRMIHLGIWDSVYIETCGPVCIDDLFVRPLLSPAFDSARVSAKLSLSSHSALDVEVNYRVTLEGAQVKAGRGSASLPAGDSELPVEFTIDRPELWWPNGYGDQPLYRLEVELTPLDHEAGLPDPHQVSARQVGFGIRQVRFLPNEGGPEGALPYTVEVNGRRIYLNGWNWVPLDVMYGVERPEKLRHLLALARQAHINLLRVWGGGLIEKESFYDLCDRLGILVWQDFIQSSSGIENDPPDDPEFIRYMAHEARQIIPRRRNHPSLILWCGGNELQDADGRPLDDRHPMLAALKAAVAELDPDRAWLPTTPSGPEFGNSLEAIRRNPQGLHDVHGPWEHQGLEQHFRLYNQGTSLLHSEFGVEGITNWATLRAIISPEHLFPVSLDSPVWFHLGAWWVKVPAWRAAFGALVDSRDEPELKRLVQAIQFWQADGLRYAVESDRRRAFRNSGTLPWQFNEPYPMAACTSAVDYYGRPKPAYYEVARAYAPLHLSASFDRQAWGRHPVFSAEIWSHNTQLQPIPAVVHIRVLGTSGEEYAARHLVVEIPAAEAARLDRISIDPAQVSGPVFFLDLVMERPGGGLLARNRYLFSTGENLEAAFDLPQARVSAQVTASAGEWDVHLKNTGRVAAMYLWIEDARPPRTAQGWVTLDHNHFCLLPGEERTIRAVWSAVAGAGQALRLSGWNIPEQDLSAPA